MKTTPNTSSNSFASTETNEPEAQMAQIREDLSTGRRVYIETAYREPIVDALKRLGAHWDRDARCWWVGSGKRYDVEKLLAEAAAAPPAAPVAEKPEDVRLVGKVSYNGRTYYARAISQDNTKVRLTTLDQQLDFWATLGAGEGQAQFTKHYAPREYRGRTEYTTLGSIQRFIARQKDPARAQGTCTECGGWGRMGETCTECNEGSFV